MIHRQDTAKHSKQCFQTHTGHASKIQVAMCLVDHSPYASLARTPLQGVAHHMHPNALLIPWRRRPKSDPMHAWHATPLTNQNAAENGAATRQSPEGTNWLQIETTLCASMMGMCNYKRPKTCCVYEHQSCAYKLPMPQHTSQYDEDSQYDTTCMSNEAKMRASYENMPLIAHTMRLLQSFSIGSTNMTGYSDLKFYTRTPPSSDCNSKSSAMQASMCVNRLWLKTHQLRHKGHT